MLLNFIIIFIIIIIYLLFFTTRNVAGNRLVCISAMPCCNELQFCRYSVQLWGLAGNLHGSFSMSPQDMSYQRQNQLSPSERRDTGRTPLEFPKNHAVTACDTAESIFCKQIHSKYETHVPYTYSCLRPGEASKMRPFFKALSMSPCVHLTVTGYS